VATIVVAGASSNTGKRVVGELLAQGRAVTAMVRSARDERFFTDQGASVVMGDVRDREAVARACQGASTVVSLVGRHFARTEEGLWDVDARGNENLIGAARAAGARRFVLLSALWSERPLAPVLFRAKRRAEQALIDSGLGYTILKPSTFMVGPSSLIGALAPTIERWGVAFIPAPDSGPVSFIAEADVARALVRSAIDDDAPNRIVELGGPERLTFAEGARRIARALGKDVRIVRVPRAALSVLRRVAKRRGFGAYEGVLFLEMIADIGYDCDPAPARELIGAELTTADAALSEYYATHHRTPWRDSNFGTVVARAH
jgi:NADH dehydrogenase